MLAVTACPNGIAHTYMAAEALTKMGDKLGLPTKVETNGSDGAKNVLTPEEIAACDGIIIAADKRTSRPPASTASRCCLPAWTMASTSRRS